MKPPSSTKSLRVFADGPYRQYQPIGRSPQVSEIEAMAIRICSASCSRERFHISSQRQPCPHGSWPASLTHAPTSRLRSIATEQAYKVIGILYSLNSRSSRQTPARDPYSKTDSAHKSRNFGSIS